jgi:hypothetical protein
VGGDVPTLSLNKDQECEPLRKAFADGGLPLV